MVAIAPSTFYMINGVSVILAIIQVIVLATNPTSVPFGFYILSMVWCSQVGLFVLSTFVLSILYCMVDHYILKVKDRDLNGQKDTMVHELCQLSNV